MSLDTPVQSSLHQARQKQLNISQYYTETFIEKLDPHNTYKIVACPTCGNENSKVVFTKQKGEYAYCNNCEHIFLKNQLMDNHLLRFYEDYPTSSLEWHDNESTFYRNIYNSGLSLVTPSHGKSTLLDIGCSSGYFMSIAEDQGFNCFGIEPNKKESSYAKSKGLKILGSTINEINKLGKKFNVITLWDVLEHIQDPIKYLISLRSLLNEDGKILLQVPTSDALAARIMQEKCNMFDGIEHLTLFSEKSLNIAFQKAGYTKLSLQTVITDSYAIANYLSYASNPYLDEGKKMSQFSVLDEKNIEKFGFGYKLQAVFTLA